MEHEIRVMNKRHITVDEVTSVNSFDETCIYVNLKEGGLLIYGKDLQMDGLDTDEGRFSAEGEIESIVYVKKKDRKSLRERFRK